MHISCLIVDDEPSSQNVLKSFISKIDTLELKHICNNALEALEYMQQSPIDLLFLDINMPDLSGVSFYKSLSNPPEVIFTTAYSEYALEGFELNALDYLLKPFSFERFLKAVSKIKAKKQKDTQKIILKSDKKYYQINFNSIFYIESLGDYIKIYIEDKFIVVYKPLKEILIELPNTQFVQVHKSYIINKTKIEYVEGNLVIINSTKIPLGNKFKKDFLDSFTT